MKALQPIVSVCLPFAAAPAMPAVPQWSFCSPEWTQIDTGSWQRTHIDTGSWLRQLILELDHDLSNSHWHWSMTASTHMMDTTEWMEETFRSSVPRSMHLALMSSPTETCRCTLSMLFLNSSKRRTVAEKWNKKTTIRGNVKFDSWTAVLQFKYNI